MKMTKKMVLGFCVLISLFLVSQVHADKQYLLVCKNKGLKIYLVPDKKSLDDCVINPVATLDGDFYVELAGFNPDGTILYTVVAHGISRLREVHFYSVPRHGDMSCCDKTPALSMGKKCDGFSYYDNINFAGFNPNDGTFCLSQPHCGTTIFDVNVTTRCISYLRRIYLSANLICFNTNGAMISLCKDTTCKDTPIWSRFIHRGVLDNYPCGEKGEQLPSLPLDDGYIGFSPSGDIFFCVKSDGIDFYKLQEKSSSLVSESILLGSYIGKSKASAENSYQRPLAYSHVKFLDSKHISMSSSEIVEVFEIPSCDTWTEKSISNKSFNKIMEVKLEDDIPLTFDVVLFTPPTKKLEHSKVKNNYSDVTVFTQ